MSTALTGPFATSELPRIGVDPVTVTVSRDIAPGHEAAFEAWTEEVERAIVAFPGCLGVGVLKAGATGGCYHVVFRFSDLVALRRWERSPERLELLARLEPSVLATRVQRTVGVEQWFDAPALVERPRPWWRRWLGDAAWITPIALVMTFVVSPHLGFHDLRRTNATMHAVGSLRPRRPGVPRHQDPRMLLGVYARGPSMCHGTAIQQARREWS